MLGPAVTALAAALMDDGAEPATARARHVLRRFSAWLLEEGARPAQPPPRRSHSAVAGGRGRAFSYDALHVTLTWRAELAGIAGFHPHRLGHTAVHRRLAAGGSEMAVAGGTRPDMLLPHTRAQASERAAEEARRLNLGDL